MRDNVLCHLMSCVVAGDVGPPASGQVTTEARPAAVPSTLLPSEPKRPPVAADVVSGEYLISLPYPQLDCTLLAAGLM
jgi:hypothetical protein